MGEHFFDSVSLILGFQLATLVAGLALWVRQTRILRHLDEERQWNASGFDRLQELQRIQERELLKELALAGGERRLDVVSDIPRGWWRQCRRPKNSSSSSSSRG